MTTPPQGFSRRAFLFGRGRKATVASAASPPPARAIGGGAIPVLRPPGARPESEFLSACTRCDACIKACPHDAILRAPARLRGAAGTPMIDPVHSPCRMCADLPCVTVCAPGALVRPTVGLPRMGTARIQIFDCLAHRGTTCSTCSERCPVPGAIRVEQGRPTVVADLCTGCGICQYVCPAPVNAIMVLPKARA